MSLAHRQKGKDPLAEGADHLAGGGKGDSALAPGWRARPGALLGEPLRGVLDERDAATALEKALDRRVIADVCRDTEDDDLVRVERVEQRIGVRIREHVEVLLQEEDLAPAFEHPRNQAGRKRDV